MVPQYCSYSSAGMPVVPATNSCLPPGGHNLFSHKESSNQFFFKGGLEHLITYGETLSRARKSFWGQIEAIFDFVGVVALEMVSDCQGASWLVSC